MSRRPLVLGLAVLIAAGLAGCGITNPYQTSQGSRSRPAPTSSTPPGLARDRADPGPERAGTIPAAQQAAQRRLSRGAASATQQAALRRYARLYSNWTAPTVGAVEHELASISLAQARAQALQTAASYTRDTTLDHSRVANRGAVVSIAAGQGPAQGQWVIVTSETTTGRGDYQGLPPQLHITYAQLTHTRSGWVVSQWAPQN